MYILHKRSCGYRHKKLSHGHQPEVEKPTIGEDVRAGAGDGVVAADPDPDDTVIAPPERPHRPWLVPGVGTL